MEVLDRTVKDDKFVTDILGFTVLGIVPKMTQKELNEMIQKKASTLLIKKLESEKVTESRRSRRRG